MRLNMFFYVLAAFCVLPFATAKPTKVRLSPHEARAKREQGAAPSFRHRQTTWQEIKARQELRKSPLYKRQQVSAVPTSAPNYPVCNPFRPTTNVARYTATDITTPVGRLTHLERTWASLTQFRNSDCLVLNAYGGIELRASLPGLH